MLRIFHIIVRVIGRIHIVVDGLDECEDRAAAISKMKSMLQFDSLGLMKWFCSSRKESEYESLFESVDGAIFIQPSKEESMQDISTYVEKYPGLASHQEDCLKKFKTKCDGNFLCMSLTAKTLSGDELTCKEDMDKELSRFPVSLIGCYERILRQLMGKGERQRRLAR